MGLGVGRGGFPVHRRRFSSIRTLPPRCQWQLSPTPPFRKGATPNGQGVHFCEDGEGGNKRYIHFTCNIVKTLPWESVYIRVLLLFNFRNKMYKHINSNYLRVIKLDDICCIIYLKYWFKFFNKSNLIFEEKNKDWKDIKMLIVLSCGKWGDVSFLFAFLIIAF